MKKLKKLTTGLYISEDEDYINSAGATNESILL